MQGMDLTSKSYTDKLDISVSGTTPTGGYLNYENSILKDGCLTMDEYKVTIENGEVTKTEKGSCESQSLTACDSPNFKPSPEEWFSFDASTNTITGFSDTWDGTTDITIPCQIGGVDVVNIEKEAFAEKGITSVVISDSIINIGYTAFAANPNLTELTIGKNVEVIEVAAFVGSGIERVFLPDKIKKIKNAAFSDSKITEAVILSGEIYTGVFDRNPLAKVTFGEKVTYIDTAAFANLKLTEVVIPKSVSVIEVGAFGGNNLSYVIINGSDITIKSAAFSKSPALAWPDVFNPNLTTIYNNTGKSFDWGMIINGSGNTTEYVFETGIVENEYGNVEIKKSN